VLEVNERLLQRVLAVGGVEVEIPFLRMGYDDAVARFGTDRPDTRFGLEIVDLTDAVRETEFKVFRSAVDEGGAVQGINAGRRELPRSELDGLIEHAQGIGAKGLVWAFREGDGWRSPVAKFLSDEELRTLNERLGAQEGDLLLVVADEPPVVGRTLGGLRTHLAERFDLIPADRNDVLWIVDWPLFGWDEDEGRWDALHHPFTSPEGEIDPSRPGDNRARAYDVVWNGVELGGGSIRISSSDVQRRVFEALGIGAEEAEERFGFLLEALRYGAPPHGGIAYGLDRIVAQLHGAESIRDVIAFPKTASGSDPLTGAPSPITTAQRREAGIDAAPK
ncbi:MAG: amino acid--tRNA ligase-related protein, partial [Pseudonocardiaceae bacterium]